MGTILLVRHGETTWNRDGRIQGWADSTLTDRGREQARRIGARVADAHDVDRFVASDLRRAGETASLVREAGVDREPTFSRAWRERDFGDYRGLTKAAVADRHPEYRADGSLLAVPSVPGGETREAARERVRDGWEDLLAELGDETALVVTHGGPIRVVLSLVDGRDLPALAREFSPRNCGLTVLDCTSEPAVVRCDDCSHLDLVSD